MEPEDIAALEQFQKEVSALDGDALLDRWIALRDDNPIPAELGTQKELYLETALAATFGLTKWREAIQARRKAIRNANRT
jgi:hypothetical protein